MEEDLMNDHETIPLAAGLHRDGTIHIYVNEEDSGLCVGLDPDKKGGLLVSVNESTRIAGQEG